MSSLLLREDVIRLRVSVEQQTRDFSMLSKVCKQVASIISQMSVDSPSYLSSSHESNLPQLIEMANDLLNVFFILQEQREFKVGASSSTEDPLFCSFSSVVGSTALTFLNECFHKSLLSLHHRFTESQLEELILVNVNFTRFLLDNTEVRLDEQMMELLSKLTSNSELILQMLADRIESEESFRALFLCNEINSLEIQVKKSSQQSSSPPSIAIKTAENLLTFIQSSQSPGFGVDREIIAHIFTLLFNLASDCNECSLIYFFDSPLAASFIEHLPHQHKCHILKIRLLHAAEQDNLDFFDELERTYQQQATTTDTLFQAILVIRRFKIVSSQVALFEDRVNTTEILSKLEQILLIKDQGKLEAGTLFEGIVSELLVLPLEYFDLPFLVLNMMAPFMKQEKKDLLTASTPKSRGGGQKISCRNSNQSEFFCVLFDEFFRRPNARKMISSCLMTAINTCCQSIIAQFMQSHRNVQARSCDASTQPFTQRLCKLLLEVAVQLPHLNDETVILSMCLIESFLLYLKRQQLTNSSVIILIDEVSALGLMFALRVEDPNAMREFASPLADSFSVLPQILLAHMKSVNGQPISEQLIIKFLGSVVNHPSSSVSQRDKSRAVQGERSSSVVNILELFALKNLVSDCCEGDIKLEVFHRFIEGNFQSFFSFLRAATLNNRQQAAAGSVQSRPSLNTFQLSLCTPLVRQLMLLHNSKQRGSNSELAGRVMELMKSVLGFVDRFYKYFVERDSSTPWEILLLDSERDELTNWLMEVGGNENISCDPRVSCQIYHAVVLLNCMEIVFEGGRSVCNGLQENSEECFTNECQRRLRLFLTHGEERSTLTEKQFLVLKSGKLFRSVVLLFTAQVSFYELSVKQEKQVTQQQLRATEGIIEAYRDLAEDFVRYLRDDEAEASEETTEVKKIEETFSLFSFVYAVIKNDISRALALIDVCASVAHQRKEHFVLLGMIAKLFHRKELLSIISKKYIFYLSSPTCTASDIAAEMVVDLIESQPDLSSLETIVMPLRKVLERVLMQPVLQVKEKHSLEIIIQELRKRFANSNSAVSANNIQVINQSLDTLSAQLTAK